MQTESQLRSANNDGMDPYWKPDTKRDAIVVLDKIEELYRASSNVVGNFDKFTDEELNEDNMVLKVTMSTKSWLRLRNAVKQIRG